jgi:uncharacterized protein (TIGR02001 family)
MKKPTLTVLAAAACLAALPGASFADEPAASPLSFNIGAVSDYRYRGISQTRLKPALQGGADYAAANGLYVGTWASTIQWIKDAGTLNGVDAGKTPAELDLYGGYKGEIVKDLAFDVGGLYYLYAGNKTDKIPGGSKADTFEIYGAITYGPVTAKYSHALTNLFGVGGGAGAANSKGSGYLDVSATFDLGGGFSLAPHVGRQQVSHYSIASYTDYSLTLGKDLGSGFSLSAAVIGTNADKTFYVTPAGKFTGKSALVVGAKYSF